MKFFDTILNLIYICKTHTSVLMSIFLNFQYIFQYIQYILYVFVMENVYEL